MLYEPVPIPEKTTSNRKSYHFMLYFKQKSQRVQHKSDYFIGSCCKQCGKVSNAGKQAMRGSKQCGQASKAGKQAMQESKQCGKASNALQRDSARTKRNQTPDLPASLTHSQNNAILYQYLLSLIRGRDERNDKTK